MQKLQKEIGRKVILCEIVLTTLDDPTSDTQGNLRSDLVKSQLVEENPNGKPKRSTSI